MGSSHRHKIKLDLDIKMSVTRTVRGKRPKIYTQDGMDHLMAMTMALVQEVAVLRDRVDLVERVADSKGVVLSKDCLLYTSPSPRDATLSRMPSSA